MQKRHKRWDFLNVCKYLEDNDDEQLTMSDLVSKMEEYCNDKIDAYSKKHMKRKIIDHFGEKVLISNSQTKEDVMTLKSTAKNILSEYFASPELDSEEDKKQVLLDTAAKLIKNDINPFWSAQIQPNYQTFLQTLQ